MKCSVSALIQHYRVQSAGERFLATEGSAEASTFFVNTLLRQVYPTHTAAKNYSIYSRQLLQGCLRVGQALTIVELSKGWSASATGSRLSFLRRSSTFFRLQ